MELLHAERPKILTEKMQLLVDEIIDENERRIKRLNK